MPVVRRFAAKEEVVARLTRYLEDLKAETAAVEERLRQAQEG